MNKTEIDFTITIDGTFVVPTEETQPIEEAREDMLEAVSEEWEPRNPTDGEEVSVAVEMEYNEGDK